MTGTTAGKSHRVAFYADICYDSELSPAYWTPPANLDVDAILLGGDIHYSPERLAAMLADIRQARGSSTPIVVVPGNGEYVKQELDYSRGQYRAAVAAIPNAIWLDNEVVVLPGGLRIIGSTLPRAGDGPGPRLAGRARRRRGRARHRWAWMPVRPG